MSEVAETRSSAKTQREQQADQQALAQVEKWMAMIRALNEEREPERKA